MNEPMSPGAAFTAIMGLIVLLVVSIWAGLLLIVAAIVWQLTHKAASHDSPK